MRKERKARASTRLGCWYGRKVRAAVRVSVAVVVSSMVRNPSAGRCVIPRGRAPEGAVTRIVPVSVGQTGAVGLAVRCMHSVGGVRVPRVVSVGAVGVAPWCSAGAGRLFFAGCLDIKGRVVVSLVNKGEMGRGGTHRNDC